MRQNGLKWCVPPSVWASPRSFGSPTPIRDWSTVPWIPAPWGCWSPTWIRWRAPRRWWRPPSTTRGARGGAGHVTWAADHGLRFSGADYAAWANDETMVFGILEDERVLDVLPEILKVEGLDGFTIGRSDLSMGMGLVGQMDHPRVADALSRLIRTVLASEQLLSLTAVGANPAEEAPRSIQMGTPMIAQNIRNLITRSGLEFMRTVKAGMPSPSKP